MRPSNLVSGLILKIRSGLLVDYSRALLARNIQRTIGRPTTKSFLRYVDKNLLPNCPVTREDILAAEHIFGPDIGSLKGKTTRRKPDPVRVNITSLPDTVMSRYRDVELTADVMKINKIPFFVSVSRKIKFGTAEFLQSQTNKSLFTAVKQIRAVYMKRGFRITNVLMDGQFESMRGELSELGITLNTVSNNEHVPEIERYIRTVKERVRCTYNSLPFEKMPPRLIIEMVYSSVFWLNSFPPVDGVSTTLSPRSIVVGLNVDYNKHCRIEFGTYAQVHEKTIVRWLLALQVHSPCVQPVTRRAVSTFTV